MRIRVHEAVPLCVKYNELHKSKHAFHASPCCMEVISELALKLGSYNYLRLSVSGEAVVGRYGVGLHEALCGCLTPLRTKCTLA